MANLVTLALLGLSIAGHGVALPQVKAAVEKVPVLGGAVAPVADTVEGAVGGAVPEPVAPVVDTVVDTAAPVLDKVADAVPATDAADSLTQNLPIPGLSNLANPLELGTAFLTIAIALLKSVPVLPDVSTVTDKLPVDLPVKAAEKRQLSGLTGILGGGSSPLNTVTGLAGGAGGSPLDVVTGALGGAGGSPLDAVTGALGGAGGTPLDAVTGLLGGAGGNPLALAETLAESIAGKSKAAKLGPLGVLTDTLKGLPVAGELVKSVPIIGGPTGSNPLSEVNKLTGGASNQILGSVLKPVAETAKSVTDTVKGVPIAGGVVSELTEGMPLVGGSIGAGATPLGVVSKIGDGLQGGDPLAPVTDVIGAATGGAGGSPLGAATGVLGGAGGSPLDTVTALLAGGLPVSALTGILSGGTGAGSPLSIATSLLSGGLPIGTVTGLLSGGAGAGSPLSTVTTLLNGGLPLGAVTGLLGGGLLG